MDFNFTKYNKIIRYFLLCVFFVGILYTYTIKDYLGLIIAIISPIFIFLPVILKKIRINIPESYYFVYYIILFLAFSLGETLGLYIKTIWFDKFIHFLTGIFLFILGLSIIYKFKNDSKIKNNFIKYSLLSIFFVLLIQGSWELYELLSDTFLGTNMLQSGLNDSLLDTLMNFLGALLGAIICFINIKIRKIKIIDYYLKGLRE